MCRLLRPWEKSIILATLSSTGSHNFLNISSRAVDIYERAYQVGRLEELMEKRGEFDWTGVPELKSKYLVDWYLMSVGPNLKYIKKIEEQQELIEFLKQQYKT